MKLIRPDYRITRNTYFMRDLKTRVTKERAPLQIAEQILVVVSIVFYLHPSVDFCFFLIYNGFTVVNAEHSQTSLKGYLS